MSRAEQKLAEHKKTCEACIKADTKLDEMCGTGRVLSRVVFSEKNLR